MALIASWRCLGGCWRDRTVNSERIFRTRHDARPAAARGIAELNARGRFERIDRSRLSDERIETNQSYAEQGIWSLPARDFKNPPLTGPDGFGLSRGERRDGRRSL